MAKIHYEDDKCLVFTDGNTHVRVVAVVTDGCKRVSIGEVMLTEKQVLRLIDKMQQILGE